MPVSVVSKERSSSKLELVKNFLEIVETAAQTNSSIVRIEHNTASELSYEDIFKTHPSRKARNAKS